MPHRDRSAPLVDALRQPRRGAALALLLGALSLPACKVPFTATCETGEGTCTPCPACGADELCLRGRCLPRSCDGATACHLGYACLEGRCVDEGCVEVSCPAGQACARGACFPADCADSACSPSEVCDGQCTFSGCAGVRCPSDQRCAGGECLPLACDGVVCPQGLVCESGTCRDTRCVGVVCGAELVCWEGACVDATPKLEITAPNAGADLTTATASQTVSGTCSPDVTSLATSLGTLADSDCRDGTWSLKPFDLAAGEQVFTLTARNAPGGERSDSLRVTYDPPPTVDVTAPDSDGTATAYTRSTTVSGTCSKDVVEVSTSRGVVADGDCSDGTWSLEPYPLPEIAPYPFQITVRDAFGSSASDSITVTFAYLRLENGAGTVYRRFNPTTVAGRCSPEVTSLTLSGGTLTEGDCSDTYITLEYPFDAGDGSYSLTASASSATASEQATLELVYDTVPPVTTVTSAEPASPNPSNFPVIKGKAESNSSVQLFADAACTVAVGTPLPSWASGDFASKGFTVAVVDGTTSTFHARAIDRAGNLGPCSSTSVDYTDSTQALPSCDVTVAGPALTFAALQAVLDDAQARRQELLADDGAVAVCLADGVVVSTGSEAEGGRLSIPGDDFYLFAPTGRATLTNQRSDSAPDVYLAREALEIVGVKQVGLAHLDVSSARGTALAVADARVAFLRDLRLGGSPTGSKALDFYSDSAPVYLAELSGSQLSGQTAFHAGNSRIRLVQGTTFSFLGGYGLHLDNSYVVLSELLDSTLSSDHATSGGIGLRLNSANREVSVERMRNTTFRRGPAATSDGGTAVQLTHYSDDRTYVRTPNVVDNVFCGVGAKGWGRLLDPGGLPTVPYDPVTVKGTNGARSFPWGAAAEAAANPGYNLQSQWGGACP